MRVMSVAVSYFTYPLTPSRGDPLHYPLALEGEGWGEGTQTPSNSAGRTDPFETKATA